MKKFRFNVETYSQHEFTNAPGFDVCFTQSSFWHDVREVHIKIFRFKIEENLMSKFTWTIRSSSDVSYAQRNVMITIRLDWSAFLPSDEASNALCKKINSLFEFKTLENMFRFSSRLLKLVTRSNNMEIVRVIITSRTFKALGDHGILKFNCRD